jgi:hypothetical protein
MYSEVFGFCRIFVDIAWLFIRILISQGSPWAVEREDAVLLLYPAFGDARPPAAPATPAPATCAQLLSPFPPCSPLGLLALPSVGRATINFSSR